MNSNTALEFAYRMLANGVHLNEIKRFVDAQPSADPTAETIPAPPPSQDGAVDPTTASTVPSPPPRSMQASRGKASRGMTAARMLDFRAHPPEFWDELADLVERVG